MTREPTDLVVVASIMGTQGCEKKVREGVVNREMTLLEVTDSDVASVCGFCLSIARDNRQGRGEGEEANKQERTHFSAVRSCFCRFFFWRRG